MRITAIILLFFCLHVSGKTLGQSITYSAKGASLSKLFVEFKKQSGYTFFYRTEDLGSAKPVTIDLTNVPFLKALEMIFENQPLGFQLEGRTVVVVKKELIKNGDSKNPAPALEITGKVTNDKGEPVVGATIKVKGLPDATTTDNNGEFILKGIDGPVVLQITGAEIQPQEIRVTQSGALSIKVTAKIDQLDQVVIVAYGTTTKRLNTGNVSSVKASEIERQPVNNPLLALQGRVPGLVVNQNTGVAGGGMTVRIQGQNSLSRGSDPLYVIDGVPYVSQLLPTRNSSTAGILGPNGNTNTASQAGGGNPMAFINPMDIESIDILKDADATAIYGSRAANGAILITTKKGQQGRSKVDLNIQSGWGSVAKRLDLLDTRGYLDMRYEAYKNDGVNWRLSSVNANDLKVWDTTRYTDWQSKLIGGTARYSNAQVGFSGGNSTTSFLVGGGFHHETTVFPGDSRDRKGSFHVNLNHVSLNQKFRVSFNGNYLADENHLIFTDLTQMALKLAPNAPAIYTSSGELNWAPLPNGNSTWYNPYAYLNNKYKISTENLISNLVLGYQLAEGLNLITSLGYTNLRSDEISVSPIISRAPETRTNSSRSSIFSNNMIKSWIIEPQITYKRKIASGTFEFLIGSTLSRNTSSGAQLFGTGYNSDLELENIKAASTVGVASSINSIYKYNAVFGRVNYNLKNTYLLNLTGRRDGSSRFGSENLFHNFGALGGAWIFTNEPSLKRALPFLSFGKMKMSYGITGNDQIGDYQFMNLYDPYAVSVPYQGVTGLIPTSLTNQYLQWEKTQKLQIGLDLGFDKDRTLIGINYYRNRSSNLLQGYLLPYTTGFNDIQINFPATIQNTGWEISVSSKLISSSGFSWDASFNLTIPRNKLVKFPNLENSSFADIYVVGQPISIRKVYEFAGVNPESGLYRFNGQNGHVTSSPQYPADAVKLVNVDPGFYGGIQNNFTFHGISLGILFQFTRQTLSGYEYGNFPGRFSSTTSGSVTANQPVSVLNRWRVAGDNAPIQRFSASYPSAVSTPYSSISLSTGYYSDASYARLKNLFLSWSLPSVWVNKLKMQDTKLTVSAQNLLTITGYDGLDPETASLLRLPPLRVITVGIAAKF